MERNRYAIVLIFSTGHSISGLFENRTLRQCLRLIRKHPKLIYLLIGSFLCGVLTGSRHRHVLPADGEIAVNYDFLGVKYLPYQGVARLMPGVRGWIQLPGEGDPPDLTKYEGRTRSVIYATLGRIIMWATFGLIQCDNCTSLTRMVMRDMGIPVSRWAWSPKHLLLWCTENGYDYFAGDPPVSGGSTD